MINRKTDTNRRTDRQIKGRRDRPTNGWAKGLWMNGWTEGLKGWWLVGWRE